MLAHRCQDFGAVLLHWLFGAGAGRYPALLASAPFAVRAQAAFCNSTVCAGSGAAASDADTVSTVFWRLCGGPCTGSKAKAPPPHLHPLLHSAILAVGALALVLADTRGAFLQCYETFVQCQ